MLDAGLRHFRQTPFANQALHPLAVDTVAASEGTFSFCSAECPHHALGYETPDRVYREGIDGGALFVGKFGDVEPEQESAIDAAQASAKAPEANINESAVKVSVTTDELTGKHALVIERIHHSNVKASSIDADFVQGATTACRPTQPPPSPA